MKVYVTTCPRTGVPDRSYCSLSAAKERISIEFRRWNHQSLDNTTWTWFKNNSYWELQGEDGRYPLCRIYELLLRE